MDKWVIIYLYKKKMPFIRTLTLRKNSETLLYDSAENIRDLNYVRRELEIFSRSALRFSYNAFTQISSTSSTIVIL